MRLGEVWLTHGECDVECWGRKDVELLLTVFSAASTTLSAPSRRRARCLVARRHAIWEVRSYRNFEASCHSNFRTGRTRAAVLLRGAVSFAASRRAGGRWGRMAGVGSRGVVRRACSAGWWWMGRQGGRKVLKRPLCRDAGRRQCGREANQGCRTSALRKCYSLDRARFTRQPMTIAEPVDEKGRLIEGGRQLSREKHAMEDA